ncbi:PREDICTED: protein CIP2A-like [Priapulus caudatus]|uniref:Protein CIP2A-like n=1 Tax=Priapulus caudatus TaxID=37621 RepID=A0ABM1DWU3_PRICU|nr:PREDICTED: protein CIP2A-like [Priapulus caudatus]
MSCSSVDTSVRSLLQRAYLCIEQGTSANQQSLEDEVELVHRYLSKNDAWEGVTMSQNKELLLCLTDITINPGSEITLLEKVIRLLLGLSKSTEVVKELQSLQLCSILALKITQHPPTEEILELCLRLLAKISYKDTQGITCVAELIDTLASFILAEERLQVSLTILANLTSNYKVASTCIKKLGNSRAVIKKLIILLSNQPSFLVVLAQSILTNVCLCYPELGETWFRTSRNVGQTVQIVFNVVLRGDNEPELQHYAVDLFMTVLRSNNLRHYLDTATPEHISHCLDEATRRLSSLPHDSATRVLQLLLALCELKASREYLYKIFGVSGQKQDLTLTPLVSLISLASDPSASTCDNTSLLALDMLRKLMKEACKKPSRMHSSLFQSS